jgi:hypothetical protein
MATIGIRAMWRARDERREPISVHRRDGASTTIRRLLLVVLAAGVAVRVALLLAPDVWSDETANGLMSLAVLRGELPVYLYGQDFMGVLDAYLAAPLHYVFGPSILTLKLLPVALTLTWLVLTVRLAWEAFGPRAAVFVAALLAVPPDFLLKWAVEARTKYHLCVVLGTLALLFARRPPGCDPRRDALRAGVLGLILGLGFWTNFLTVVFFPPVAILWLRRGVGPALRGLPPAAVAFGLGSLPHWIYGLQHGTELPDTGGWIGWAALAEHVEAASRVAWPIVAGVPASVRDEPAGVMLAVALALVFGLAAVAAVRVVWRRPRGGQAALVSLLALVVTNVGLVVGTQHGDRIDSDPKYFLPLYTALPTLAGVGLAALPRVAWVPLLAGLLAVQGAGAAGGELQRLGPHARADIAALRQVGEETMAALERDGPRRFYAPDLDPRLYTFLSHERIVVSNQYEESYPPYALAVDGAETAGWWLAGPDPAFEGTLRALGVHFTRRTVGPYAGIYTDFSLPPEGLRELDPTRFTVTASVAPETAGAMVDRDVGTVWSSRSARQGGEWIEVDLGRVEPVALVRWLPGTFQEVPNGLLLEASRDGRAWQRLVDLPQYFGPLYWSAGRPMGRVRTGRVEFRVPLTPARYLRVTQTGRNALWPWTIRELFVYGATNAPARPPTADGPTLARALRATGVRRLYADHGWGSRAALADPGLLIPPANLALDAYNFSGAAEDFWPRLRWEPGSGVLLEPFEAESFAALAHASGLGVTRASVGGLDLFVYAPAPARPGTPLPASTLAVTASRASGKGRLALDGDPTTRWATGHPQSPGDWVQIELAEPRVIRAVRLWTATPSDSPRGLALEGSEGGTTWQPLVAELSTEGLLRWGGMTVLHDGLTAVRLDFPPVKLRALRLTLTRSDPVFDWSIHELTVYGAE